MEGVVESTGIEWWWMVDGGWDWLVREEVGERIALSLGRVWWRLDRGVCVRGGEARLADGLCVVARSGVGDKSRDNHRLRRRR